MTNDDLEAHLRELGYGVEQLIGADSSTYILVRGYRIPAGSLAKRACDLAILRTPSVPYVLPPAIHTRPALVPMLMERPYQTQQSPIGSEWQYWSRVLSGQPTPERFVTHVATIFSEV